MPSTERRNQKARVCLHSLYSRLWHESDRRIIPLPAGTRLRHAGMIDCPEAFRDQPIFLSREDGDTAFYLGDHEDKHVSHFLARRDLALADLGALAMDRQPEFAEFNAKRTSLSDLEFQKNLALKEWLVQQRPEGHRLDGWFRLDTSEGQLSEDILVPFPLKTLSVISCQSREAWIRERRKDALSR